VSPMINKALQAMTDKEMKFSIVLALVVDVYFGYMHQVKEVAPEGYELVHFVTIYMLGNYISHTEIKRVSWGWLLLGMLVLMTGLHIIKMRFFPISVIYSLHYNSPCLLIASTMMFLWAKTWKLQSQAVNWFAGGVFAVYLIHCNPYFSPYYWQIMKAIRDVGSWFVTPLLVGGVSAGFFCAFVVFDKLRALIFTPMECKIAERLSVIGDRLMADHF